MINTTAAVYSDAGNLRKFNEDSYYVSPDENLVIVCDGMGGQVAGGLASKMAVETIKDVFSNFEQQHLDSLFPDLSDELSPAARRVISAIRLANRRIYKMATKFPKLRGMGTTVAVLTFDESLAIMMHVGDSRIFRISEGKMVQLTEDHSWLNELIEDKEIEGDEIQRFSKKNIITRALGTASSIKIDIHCEKYTKDDLYILCTDGLHNSLNSKEIKSIVSKPDPLAKIAEKLTKKAKRRDGSDNITVALVKIDENGTTDTVSGISTTIHEEDYTILSREDKFIRQRYNDSKVPDKKRTLSANQSRALLAGALVISLVLAASLFIKSQSRSNAGAAAIEKTASTNTFNTEKFTNDLSNNRNQKISALSIPLPQNLQHLQAKKDAVLALIFFGSFAEYEKSLSEGNRIILDTMQPYLNDTGNSLEGELTLFIVDDSNDVLHKKIITLPKPGGKAP